MSNETNVTAANKMRKEEQQEKNDEKTEKAMSKTSTKAVADKEVRPHPSFAMAMEAFGMGWPSSK